MAAPASNSSLSMAGQSITAQGGGAAIAPAAAAPSAVYRAYIGGDPDALAQFTSTGVKINRPTKEHHLSSHQVRIAAELGAYTSVGAAAVADAKLTDPKKMLRTKQVNGIKLEMAKKHSPTHASGQLSSRMRQLQAKEAEAASAAVPAAAAVAVAGK